MQKHLVRLIQDRSGQAEWYHVSRSESAWKIRQFRSGSTGSIELFGEGRVGESQFPPAGFTLTHVVSVPDACRISEARDPGIANAALDAWRGIVKALEPVRDQHSNPQSIALACTSVEYKDIDSEISSESNDNSELETCLKMMFGLMAELDRPQSHITPTVIFEEGWMLRLCLSVAFRCKGCLPFEIESGAKWFSEVSPPRPSFFKREGATWLDGVVGHCGIKAMTKRRLVLNADATQFVVIEAKMAARLSHEVKHHAGYGQAARILACMTEAIRHHRPTGKLGSGLYIFCPEKMLATNRPIVSREAIHAAIRQRIMACESAEDANRWMEEWCEPLLTEVQLCCESWQSIISLVGHRDPEVGRALRAFYVRCEKYN